jgi:Flp pilus assembly protein TadD/transcription elongation GreA/GreB family factor
LETYLLGVGKSLATAIGKHGLEKLLNEPSVAKAARLTDEDFSELENVSGAIEQWCTSSEFGELVSNFEAGGPQPSDDQVISDFLKRSNFYAGAGTEHQAFKVLAAFFWHLQREIYAELYGLSVLATRQEAQHQTTQGMVADVGAGVRDIAQQMAQLVSASQVNVQDEIARARLEDAERLRAEGRPEAALSVIANVLEGDQRPSREVEVRAQSVKGGCLVDLDDFDAAAACFNRAYELEPDGSSALANQAVALILQKHPDEAAALAEAGLRREPTNARLVASLIRAWHLLDKAAEISRFVLENPWVRTAAASANTLGDMAYDAGDFGEAEAYFRAAALAAPNNLYVKTQLALAIMAQSQQAVYNDPALIWRLDSGVRLRLQEADALLTEALDGLKNHDNRRLRAGTYVNRSAARALFGEYKAALDDCERALHIDESQDLARRNKGLLLLGLGEPKAAIDEFLLVKEDPNLRRIQLALADAYAQTKHAQEAVNVVEPMLDGLQDYREKIQARSILLDAYHQLGRSESAETLVQQLVTEYPDDPEALSVIASYRFQQGERDLALKMLERALELASGNQKDRIAQHLAKGYVIERRYTEAARLYAGIADTTSNNENAREYLQSLFESGARDEALDVARSIRGGGPAIPVVSDVEATLLEPTDPAAARELRRELAANDPTSMRNKIRLAVLENNLGNRVEAIRVVEALPLEAVMRDREALIQMAQVRAALGLPGFLTYAYEAQRLLPKNARVGQEYVRLLLRGTSPVDPTLNPQEVTEDSVVSLQSNGDESVLTIERVHRADGKDGEFSMTDDLIKPLIGKRVGDLIELDLRGARKLYLVKRIDGKYLVALRYWTQNRPS